ncbi:MAG: polysaccharide biosynthesis protein, partial [Actinobacteria bacterium]|nr:polysaccharide biosynthesis protein [Actinomycetota bacterium]
VLLGWGTLGASIVWAVPVIPALLLAFAVMARQLQRDRRDISETVRGGAPIAPVPVEQSGPIPRRVAAYAAPRVVSAVFEQLLIWGGVLVVGAVASAADAGVYAAASRFVAAGMIVDTALRVVVAPMFSRLHHAGDAGQLGSVFRTATTWLLLFSTPIFLLLAVFAPLMLGITGPEFVRGAEVLAIMSLGTILVLLAGNIHSVLIMGGRSGLAAVNKFVVVAVNLALIPLLMPVFGLAGAAWAWVVATALDALLATLQVRFALGIRLPLVAGVRPLAIGVLAVGGAIFLAWCRVDRSRLELAALLRPSSAARIAPPRRLRGIHV